MCYCGGRSSPSSFQYAPPKSGIKTRLPKIKWYIPKVLEKRNENTIVTIFLIVDTIVVLTPPISFTNFK